MEELKEFAIKEWIRLGDDIDQVIFEIWGKDFDFEKAFESIRSNPNNLSGYLNTEQKLTCANVKVTHFVYMDYLADNPLAVIDMMLYSNKLIGIVIGGHKKLSRAARKEIASRNAKQQWKDTDNLKQSAISHYIANKANYANLDEAADDISVNVIHGKRAPETVKDWINGLSVKQK